MIKAAPVRILLACMPKSGSTFLSDLICALPDFKRAKLSPTPAGGRQHELDEGRLRRAGHGNFVGQVHVLNSDWTAKMCTDFGLKPVVLVRSLPDAIVSLRDHIRREGGAGPLLPIRRPSRAARRRRARGHDRSLLRALVRELLHELAQRAGNADDQLRGTDGRSQRRLRKVVDFAGAVVDDHAIARAVMQVQGRRESRFNVGVAGRGATLQPEISAELAACSTSIPRRRTTPMSKGCALKWRRRSRAAARRRSARWRSAPPSPRPPAAERPADSVRIAGGGAALRLPDHADRGRIPLLDLARRPHSRRQMVRAG